MATTTQKWDEEQVWRALQSRRFHQLTNPDPKTPSDITSTWTIPSAGKDELIFHDDGTYIFSGQVQFIDGQHLLTREGRGTWTLFQEVVQPGEWIAVRLASVEQRKTRKEVSAEAFFGRKLWKVQINGPDLVQEGQALALDDVNECGVETDFEPLTKEEEAKAAETNTDVDARSTKRIKSMSWWVDDLLSWRNEKWLSTDDAKRLRARQSRQQNPKFKSFTKGFLNKRKQSGNDQQTDEASLDFVPFGGAPTSSAQTGKDSGPVEVSNCTTTSESASTLLKRKKLPPLVPQRSDIKSDVPKPRKPHTYCGVRIEDLAIAFMLVTGLLFVYWQSPER